MPASKRSLHATAALTETPPETLPSSHTIAKIEKGVGNNLYSVLFSSSESSSKSQMPQVANGNESTHQDLETQSARSGLVELPSRFRNKIWLKRGGYVVVDREAFTGRDNKLHGEIVNVVRDEKAWMKQTYWPADFHKKVTVIEDSDEEESNMGKMPPSSDEDDNDG